MTLVINLKKERNATMIKNWIIEPLGDGLWRAEIIATADAINSIEDVIEELDKIKGTIIKDAKEQDE